ncbi:MAG: diguanylate cyclase [Proteobacteria bacterium]|nr:diguanylate cyclase [Pseudomonadota bacterium]
MNIRRNIIVFCVLWTILISSSLVWMTHNSRAEQQRIALLTSRALFKQIVVARRWNSSHGGVYTPVTENNQPNPYLEDLARDLRIGENLVLTKINPAFMTRQISEIALLEDGVQFHITSLNPIRPENLATAAEKQFLVNFEKGIKEDYAFMQENGQQVFHYMAPLITEKSCLKCHEKQGYREGDIRGGISVKLPFSVQVPLVSMTIWHALIWAIGLVGVNFLGLKLDRSYNVIKSQAVMDALTGIPNRRSFSERILEEFIISRKNDAELSVIMCDIDKFKKYNDRYGHVEGDACLRKVAQCIQDSLKRPIDFCARYGGEEFVVVLPNSSLKGAMTVAERIRENVENMKIEHCESKTGGIVTISLGLATSKIVSANSYEQLISSADQALYLAKKRGRNKVHQFAAGDEKAV